MPESGTSVSSSEIETREALLQIVNSYIISQCLYVAAKLGIADMIKDGPKGCDELAAASEVHPPSLYRILRTLASFGIFSEDAGRRFTLSPMAQLLCRDAPNSVRGWTIMRGENFLWEPYGEILHSVRTGEPAFNHVFGMSAFEYLAKNPDASADFDDAMRSISAQKNQSVADGYDFSEVRRIVDVGGGNGGLITTILNKNPEMKGLLCDLPHVIEGAKEHIRAAGLASRCQCLSIDMFKEVPAGGDAYTMANVIHDWDDEQCVTILKNCRRAMEEGARALLIEMVISPRNQPHLSKLADIEMLVMTEGGKERSETEYEALFEEAGFRLARVVPTDSPWSVIEGVAV